MSENTDYIEKLNELNEKIVLEPENIQFYQERAELYSQNGCFNEVIDDYTKLIEIEPDNKNFYLTRSAYYLFMRENEKAYEDFDKYIDMAPNDISTYINIISKIDGVNKWYDLGYFDYTFFGGYDYAVKCADKLIDFDINNAEYYAKRAHCSRRLYCGNPDYYSDNHNTAALSDYTKAIELDHDNPDYYAKRAATYFDLGKHGLALEDYNRAIELDPDNSDYYAERAAIYKYWIYGEDVGINNHDGLLVFFSFTGKYDTLIQEKKNYNKEIEHNSNAFNGHSFLYYFTQKYPDETIQKAKNDYDKAIELDPDKAYLYSARCDFYEILEQHDKALLDINKAIELGSDGLIGKFYGIRGTIFRKMGDYRNALEDHNMSITLNPYSHKNYLYRAKLFFVLKRYEEALDDLSKCIKFNWNCYDAYNIQKECYYEIEKYDDASWSAFEEYMAIRRSDESDFFDENPHIENIIDFIKKIAIKEKKQAIIDERNKIIADLSHSIKNLISTVIDPLENMKKEHAEENPVIENALKGANLIREIVNAMNLSFKGSIDDFYYDAEHNSGKEALSLQDIISQSLTYSIGHMFDGKYFANFLRKYFPERSIFQEAKSAWSEKSQTKNMEELLPFFGQYFFDIQLNISDMADLRIGNEKGSAIKLLILFQEIIFNAVKYSAFVEKDNRFLHIDVKNNGNQIVITVENRYKKTVKTKTSGLGLVIIKNFAKLLENEPDIRQDEEIYAVTIRFSNFWKEKSQ